MTGEALRAAIKKPPIPWLILAGEEEYLKRHYLREIRKALVEDGPAAPFNHLRFEGEAPDLEKLKEALAAPPMFADYKLIEYHLCDFEKMKADELSALIALFEQKEQYPDTTLVFYAEAERLTKGTNPKKPSRRYTDLENAIEIAYFGRSTDGQLLGWIARHLAHEGLTHTPAAGEALLARCGRSMEVLAGELEKLAAYAKANGRGEVTVEDVSFVTVTNFEADAFGLGNAILAGNAALAYLNLQDMKNRRCEPSLIFGTVFRLFCDLYAVALLREEGLAPAAIREKTGLHEYKVTLYLRAVGMRSAASLGETLERCRRLDLSGKAGGVDYAGLERLIAEETARLG